MPGKRVSMRKTREVLRLYHELKLGQRQIARSACLSQNTVHDYLERFAASGLRWPLPSSMTDTDLETALFPAPSKPMGTAKTRPSPDFARVQEELRNKHVTLQLLWEEYRLANPDTYAEAAWSQDTACWIGAHVRAFEYIGGVPELVVPDNPRTGVIRTCRYEPDLNPTYQEMAMHYGVGVMPARVRKPRDKAKVEVGVQIVQRWIVAALRHHRFFSLKDLNLAIVELLEKLNHSTRWPLQMCAMYARENRMRQ